MENNHQYEVNVEWTEDRKGIISSPVLHQKIEIATPPDFPKGEPNIWSPEHLFIAAVNSCIMNTFFAIAENSELEYESYKSNAIGIVKKSDETFTVTEIKLKIILTIANAEESDKALRVIEMSEKNCLISNSVKSTIIVEPEIIISS
ncbi:peroxiredoxin-like protein [Flavobacterium sp. PL11]|jgi:peroxiredoxin-like protein|uniref:OsmC family protein n=1 Tax=Flavobacterium sp. PL11 TaxID=3071717 RepID=UPI002E05607A|nr:peroxiredoxin-like protein [Flavobacterium sp. PL11]